MWVENKKLLISPTKHPLSYILLCINNTYGPGELIMEKRRHRGMGPANTYSGTSAMNSLTDSHPRPTKGTVFVASHTCAYWLASICRSFTSCLLWDFFLLSFFFRWLEILLCLMWTKEEEKRNYLSVEQGMSQGKASPHGVSFCLRFLCTYDRLHPRLVLQWHGKSAGALR